MQILVACGWPEMRTDQSICPRAWLPCGEAGTGWERGQQAWGSPAPAGRVQQWCTGATSVPWHAASWARPVRLEVSISFFPNTYSTGRRNHLRPWRFPNLSWTESWATAFDLISDPAWSRKLILQMSQVSSPPCYFWVFFVLFPCKSLERIITYTQRRYKPYIQTGVDINFFQRPCPFNVLPDVHKEQ